MSKELEEKLKDLSYETNCTGEEISSNASEITDAYDKSELFDISCELEYLRDKLTAQIINLGELMNKLEEENGEEDIEED